MERAVESKALARREMFGDQTWPAETFSGLNTSFKAGVNVKPVLRSLNTAFLPISRSRFTKSLCLSH